MSALDALLQGLTNTQNTSTVNLCVRVDIWEQDQIKGVRLDTNEQVVVRLGSFEKKPDAQFDRPSIQTLKEKKRCSEGAIIFFENCVFQERDGFWLARWPNIIKKSEKDKKNVAAILRAKVFIGKNPTSQKEYIEIKALGKHDKPVQYQEINTIDDLFAQAEAHLKPIGSGSTPYLLIYANDGNKSFSFEIKASLIEQNDNGEVKIVVDPNTTNSINKYLETKYGEVLKSCIDHPDVKIKVTSGKSIFCGTATRDAMLKGAKGEFLKKEFLINKEEQYFQSNLGYKSVVIGVRDDEEIGTKYAVFVSSLKPFEEPETVEAIMA